MPRRRNTALVVAVLLASLGLGIWLGVRKPSRALPARYAPTSTAGEADLPDAPPWSAPRAEQATDTADAAPATVMRCPLPDLQTSATTGELQVPVAGEGFPYLQVAIRDGYVEVPVHLIGQGRYGILEVAGLGQAAVAWSPDHSDCQIEQFIRTVPPTHTIRCPLSLPDGLEAAFLPTLRPRMIGDSPEQATLEIDEISAVQIGAALVIDGPERGAGELAITRDGEELFRVPVSWDGEDCAPITVPQPARVAGTAGPLLGKIVRVDLCGKTIPVESDGTFQAWAAPGTCVATAWREDGRLRAYSEPVSVDLRADRDATLSFTLPEEEIGGIGFQLAEHPDGIEIQRVYPDTPAALAGLRPGDIIIAVEGIAAAELSTEGFVRLGTGPVGSEVLLTLLHADGEEEDLTLIRASF